MNFAEWTKQQQKKNGGSQTGTSRPTATASTISFSDWTKQKNGVQAERPVAAPKTEVPSVADKYTAPASTKVDNSKRIGELETKIGSVEKDIGNLRVGASRARAYGGAAAIEEQLNSKQKELADLQAELFTLRDAAAETAREKAEVRQDRAKVEAKKTGTAVPIGEAAGRSAAAKMLNDPQAKKAFSEAVKKNNEAQKELTDATRVVDMYDYIDKYEDRAYEDNFWGQTGANYTLGRMTQDSSLAWSEYLNNPTEENRKYAESIDALLEKFVENNEDTLADDGTLRLISRSGANYLPQLIDQTKYSAIGGAAGALGGSVIPGVGTAAGLKAGIVAGSGVYSYNTMRGAAFKTLIDLGVDEETARAAANDEAVISSLIEMGDTAIDLLTLGASKLLTAAGKQGLKGLGAVLTKWAGESAAKKFGLALGKYGLNIFSEGIEEGLQQSVSLANQQRIVNGEGGGVGNLIGRSASVLWDAAMGKNADAAAEILDASKEGMKIAALMGGADAAVAGTATAINKRLSAKQEAGTESKEQAGTGSATSKEPTAPNAGKTDVKPEADPVVAEQQAPAAAVETAEQQTAQEAWNQAAARAFGETGAKAFQTVNDGSIDSEALYAGFAVYHHAGMTGRDMNTITSQYAKNLPEDLRKIAYDAGVQDAAASVKARTEAAATATVYGKDAGVIANDYSKSMDQDVVRTLDRVAKSLGRKVVVEDLGDSNGLLDSNGVIHVDIHAENPHLVVAAHEVTHVMEDMAPAAHKRYRDYVLNILSDVNGGSILELVEAQKAAYAGKQILSDEQAMNELVADYTARMMKDRNLFAEFAQKDRTAAQKLLDAVKKFLQKVKAVFSGNRQAQNEAAQREFGMDISMVEEAAKLWQEALTASQAQAQTANKNTDQKAGVEVRYSKKVSSLTEADVRDLLEACINGEFPDGSYIPIRRNTPAILLEKVQEHSNGEVMAENLPIIMNVGKVRQAMDEEDGASYGSNRPHGISDDGMIELIKKMDDPAYIVYQVDNGRYSEVVRYRDKKTGKETLTVMDFGDNKKASYMNGYEGGTYNVLVTTYNPDSLQSYLSKNEVIYDKKKDAPQRGSGSILPSHLNGSPFADIVTQDDGKSKQESTADKDGVVMKDDGTPVAAVYDNGSSRLSLKTYKDGGRSFYEAYLEKQVRSKNLTADEATDMLRQLDAIYDICNNYRNKYAPFGAWSDAAVQVDSKGNPVFSVIKKNGEYVMNLDFSLVCKKRRTLDGVFNLMVKNGMIDKIAMGEADIVKINDIIRSHGFETACALCFVDAKRFRQANVALQFADIYNDMVKSMIPEGSNLKVGYHNFGGNAYLPNVTGGIDTLDDSELDMTHINEVLAGAPAKKANWTVEHKVADYLKRNPADRKLVDVGDFMSTAGFEQAQKTKPGIMGLYNAKKGSGGPKAAFGDVQYLNDILKRSTAFNAKKAYAIGGVRVQSFSDYVPRMVFDYVQMISELAAKKLPAHAYTKEPLFAMQYGKTGMKINLSLIPKVVEGGIAPGLDANGNYVWADESFPYDVAVQIQKAEGYSKNCGTICVGVSDEHIRALMADDNIRMVIPYHKSGLNHIVASMNKIDQFEDYTNVQNTRYADSGTKLSKEDAKKEIGYNQRLLDTGDPRKAAEEYVRWCEENNYLPKFDQFAYMQIDGEYVVDDEGRRVVDENYYKLLEDFTGYDNGTYAPQGAVTMNFPTEGDAFGSMAQLIEQGLEEDAILEANRAEKLPKILDDIASAFGIAGEDGARRSVKGGSVVDTAAARAEDVDALKRQVEYWKSQVKQTKGFKVNTKDVEKLAKQLMRTYKVDTDTNVLTKKLQDLYDGIATGYYGNKDIDYETAQTRSEEIAKIIVEDAVETENEMYVEYAELRKYLRSTTLNISAEDSHDIPDFNDFRKRNMGRMRIGTKGTNIDTVYKEMATLWPEFFNEETETTPSDQLLRIAEVMEGVYRTQAVNPFGRYAEEAVSDIADEVLAYFFTLPQAQTFADKAAARLKQSTADARLAGQMSQGRQDAKQLRQANDQIDRLKVQLKQAKADAAKLKQTGTRDASKLQKANEKVSELEAKLKQATADATLAGQMAQGRRDAALLRRSEELAARARQRAADALAKEKQRGAEAMQKLKDNQAAKTAKTREQRKAAELRGKIIRHSRDMSQKLLRPTDKKHVPEELQSAVAAVLQAINLESNRDTSDQVTNRTKAFQQLREAYKKLAGEVVIDPAVISGDGDQAAAGPLLQAVLDMGDIRIADMNSSQLDTVWRVLKAMEQSVRKANKLFLSAKYETISEMASQLQSDSVFRRPKKAVKAPKFLGGSGNLTLDLEIPLTFFSQYGEVGSAMYKELRDAQDYQERLINQLADQVGKIVTPKQVQEMQKEVHTFKTEDGDELKLTTAHIMELYELSKRKQAEDHLLKGGIVQPEIQSAKVDRGTDMIKLTATDIGEIISKLNKEQKQIADALQGLMTTTLADAGNRASMQAYGYKKFTGTDYWPIKSAQEALHHKVEKGANNTRSIKNIGLAQQVVPHANTALNLSGIFQTFAGHATDMIDYAAWLCPMEDANRLFNYKYKDTNGIPTGKTVKGILDKVGGSGSQTYWSNLMEDIQNGIGGPGDSAFAGIAARITGNVKGASVGANIRVVVQQPTAIFRAAAILSPANLSKGMAKGVTKGNGWKKALEHSDIAKRKERGGFEISNQMQMSEILFDDRTQLARFSDKMSLAAAKADAITWGKIWNACEWQVHGQNKALKPGSEEFYRQTAELFADVINESQVVDGVLQRSQIMRSSNQISKQMTSFMGEPTMSLNMLMRAYDAVRYEQDAAKRSKARKQAARVAAALLVADIMTALAQSLVDGLRDDDREKKYWERVLSAFTGITGDEESAWDKAVGVVLSGNLGSTMNPVGRLPYAKDLLSLIQGYSVERMDISAFSDLISAGTTFVDSLSGEGTKTWAYATKQLATAGSKVLGISASNILRDVWSIARSIAIETGNLQLQYEMEKAIYKISNDKNDSRYIGILYDAMKNDREAYEMIYADMVKNGVAEDKIAQGIEKRMKADQGVTKVEDLSSRYLTPNQEKEYDKAYSRVTGTQVWKSATEGQREKLEGNLYDLTVGNGAGEDLREKIEPGRDVGIDEVEYLLYKLAQEVVSEDGNKNTSQAEAEAAAELLTGLSKDEQAWLWQSTNKSWKSKNNPFN